MCYLCIQLEKLNKILTLVFNFPDQLHHVGRDALHTLRFPTIYLCGDIYITIEDNAIVLVLSDHSRIWVFYRYCWNIPILNLKSITKISSLFNMNGGNII